MGKEKEEKMIDEGEEEVKAPEVAEVTKEIETPEIVEAVVEKEQGPFLDLIDKITDRETTIKINVEDVGGKLFGRSLRILGKISIDLGTLKKPRQRE